MEITRSYAISSQHLPIVVGNECENICDFPNHSASLLNRYSASNIQYMPRRSQYGHKTSEVVLTNTATLQNGSFMWLMN